MMGRYSSTSRRGNSSLPMYLSSDDDAVFQHHDPYLYSSCSEYASVDCTLSLGTPSTRLNEDDHDRPRLSSTSSNMSSIGWDFFHDNGKTASCIPQPHTNVGHGGGDPLLARRCANCDTTSTPLWRNGPRGPKSLCNACGIRFKKEERRANARNSTAAAGGPSAAGVPTDQSYHGSASYYDHQHNVSSWAHQQYHSQASCYSPGANGYQYSEDTGDSFLSWSLNVADRGSLVHDFTR